MVIAPGCLAILFGSASCNVRLGPPPPPPEAALEGTWKFTLSTDPSLDEVLVFDDTGRLVERRRTVGATTISQTDIHRSTKVDGDSVTIEAVGDLGENNVFEGSFNADKTVITGTLSNVITLGSTTFTTKIGDATLTKQ